MLVNSIFYSSKTKEAHTSHLDKLFGRGDKNQIEYQWHRTYYLFIQSVLPFNTSLRAKYVREIGFVNS